MSTMLPTSDDVVREDALLRMHDSSVRSATAGIQTIVADLRVGLNKIDLRVEALPDAIDAVEANPLSVTAATTLHRLAAELYTLANGLSAQATGARRLQQHGREQLDHFETRLAEVRRLDLDGAPADESTVNGDLAEES